MTSKNHQNNFGMLRLLFACLVVFSHCATMDRDRSKEPLHHFFGTMTLGDLAVDGFFLISGYLITMSYYQSESIKSYFVKRCLRIFPGFAAASLISIFLFAPLSGSWELISKLSLIDWIKIPLKIFTLQQPWVEGAFQDINDPTKFHRLNAPMWTIRMEFICYMAVPILAFLSTGKRNYILFATTIVMLVNFCFIIMFFYFHMNTPFFIASLARLLPAFCIGACFYLFKDKIFWSGRLSLLFSISLFFLFSNKYLAEPALMTLGGYLLFNFALNLKSQLLNNIGSKVDLSYGIYLYSWPTQMLIMLKYPTINSGELCLYVLAISSTFAFLSWKLIEKPCLSLKKHFLYYKHHNNLI